MEFAKKSEHKEFIIGTENSIVEHLQFECPDKKFYPVAVQLTCMNMKVTTLMDIYNCLNVILFYCLFSVWYHNFKSPNLNFIKPLLPNLLTNSEAN